MESTLSNGTPQRIDFGSVPAELQELDQWCLWKTVVRDSKTTKMPLSVFNTAASSTDPKTWTSFDNAVSTYDESQHSGIGFVFTSTDQFCGIDLDGCRDPETGCVADWAIDEVVRFGSYTEISPSQTGLKIWITADSQLSKGRKKELRVPEIVAKTPAIEIYTQGRYFAVTGQIYKNYRHVEHRESQLQEFLKQHWPAAPAIDAPQHDWRSDDAVVERARKYVARIPGAVSGSSGHNATFSVACRLVKGFELSADQAFDVLSEWNSTCDPPWSEHDLRHKVASASKATGDTGYLRIANPERYAEIRVPNYAEKPGQQKPGTEPKLMTVKASNVEPKELDWLWQHRFLRGHINIIGGDPGLGKSMLLVDMAARASTGSNWPDGSSCKQCSVLYSTTEDGIADTVVPRLIAAGADLEKVHIVEAVKCRDDSELPLFLNEHLIYLDDMLTTYPDICILVIDTLQSHIGSAVATNNNSSVRGVMTPLKRLAEKHHVAVLCIEHLTKSKTLKGENATYRVQGSIAFAGSARSVWIVAKDQQDISGKRRYLQASKTNLTPDNAGLGLAYEICGPTGKPHVHWLETDVTTSIDQLLCILDGSSGDQSDGGELGRCCDWLRHNLFEAMTAKEIETGAKSEMISSRTLKRAKEELGIRSEKRGSVWYWVPAADMEQARTDELIEAAES